MVNGNVIVHTAQLSRLGLPKQVLKEGSQVLVRIIADKGGGKYEGSVAGARVTINSKQTLTQGSTFTATISSKNGQILLTPNLNNQNNINQSEFQLAVLQNEQLTSLLQNLGLPADSLSYHLLQQMKQLEMKLDPNLMEKLYKLAVKSGGKEKRAAELLMILAKKGLDYSEEEIKALLAQLEWENASDYNQDAEESNQNRFRLLNKLNEIKTSWQFLPYQITEEEKCLAAGTLGILCDENDRLQLLNIECNWLSTGHKYLFCLEYTGGRCTNILMNCGGSPKHDEAIARKLDSLLAAYGKNLTIEVVPAELIEGTACGIEDFYSFGGQV